uniref:F-box domain-containing protein n=1 Tax=Anser cygnoides TaxID=8845 RepID=A0A8B9DM12_ANSCY
MSVCGEAVGAGSLPSELVVHIFSFLAGPDRLRASAACSHWRDGRGAGGGWFFTENGLLFPHRVPAASPSRRAK